MKKLAIIPVLLLLLAPLGARLASPAETLTGGNATMYLGARPNRILIIDEATEKVTGFISTKTGYPEGLDLSKDKKRFYVYSSTLQDIEVIDIASRQSIDSFRLTEGNKRVWLRGFAVDPLHRFAVIHTRAATKLEDHWEIAANE